MGSWNNIGTAGINELMSITILWTNRTDEHLIYGTNLDRNNIDSKDRKSVV